MSKSRRQTPASRNNRRATITAKQLGDLLTEAGVPPPTFRIAEVTDIRYTEDAQLVEWSAWPDGQYQLGVGAYTSNEEPRRTKRRKHPLGFTGGT